MESNVKWSWTDWVIVDVRSGQEGVAIDWFKASSEKDALVEFKRLKLELGLESGGYILQRRTTWVTDEHVNVGGPCDAGGPLGKCVYYKGDVCRDFCLVCSEPKEQK